MNSEFAIRVFNILLSTVALRRESLLVTSILRHEIIWVRD